MEPHTETLAVDVGASFQQTLDNIFAFIPNILAFLLILLIGYIIAKVIQKAIAAALQKAGLDKRLHESDARKYVDQVIPGASPSNGIARMVFYLVFAFFLFSAIGALKIPALTTFMNQVLAYLPNVIVAILIFVVAAIISGAAAAGIARVMGDTPTGKVAASVLPALIMVIALFMILQQLHIAEQIVQIAFGATMFALALGLALAFGLGGRPIAQKMLEDAYAAGQRNKEQIKQDIQSGRERAQQDAQAAQSQVQDGQSSQPTYGATAQPYTDSSQPTQAYDQPYSQPDSGTYPPQGR
jgi:F0F1-type ATP synthase membrane subunit b/b'